MRGKTEYQVKLNQRKICNLTDRIQKLEAKAEFPLMMGGDIEKRIEKLEKSNMLAKMAFDLTKELSISDEYEKLIKSGWTPPETQNVNSGDVEQQQTKANEEINQEFDDMEITKKDGKIGIVQIDKFRNLRFRTWIDTKEKAIREALIELGWTPPREDYFVVGESMSREKALKMARKIIKMREDAFAPGGMTHFANEFSDKYLADILQGKE